MRQSFTQTAEVEVSEKFSLVRNIGTIAYNSFAIAASYGYSNFLFINSCFFLPKLKGNKTVLIASGALFLTILDFSVIVSAATSMVLGFIGAENYHLLQDLESELAEKKESENGDQQETIFETFVNVIEPIAAASNKHTLKIEYISNLIISGMRVATPYILLSAVILASSSFFLPWIGVEPVVASSFRTASLISVFSLPGYFIRFCNEKLLLAAGRKKFVIAVSLTGLGTGVATVYVLCLGSSKLGIDGIAIGMVVENLFTLLISMLAIRYMPDFQVLHFKKSFFSCGNVNIRKQLKPIAGPLVLTFGSEWLVTAFKNYLAGTNGTESLAAQNYVNQIFFLVSLIVIAIGEAIGIGLKGITRVVARALNAPIEDIKQDPLTLRLQSRYVHSGLLTTLLINGIMLTVIGAYPNILTEWLNTDLEPEVKNLGAQIIPYGAASTLAYALAVTMRQSQLSQTGQWAYKTFNLAMWGGATYSAVASLFLGQGIKGINQGALIGNLIACMTLVPGYLKTFCSSGNRSTFSSTWNSVSSNCSQFFNSIRRKIVGEEPTRQIQIERKHER